MFHIGAWPDAAVERLKALWDDGLSASQIAAEFGGGITRNAVIGKVHRLGLRRTIAPPTAEEIQAQIEKRRLRQRLSNRKRRGPVAFKPRVFTTSQPETKPMEYREPLNLTLDDLTMKDGRPVECRFITNDDMANATYCGHETEGESSWCFHHRLRLQPPKGWVAPAMVPKIAVAA